MIGKEEHQLLELIETDAKQTQIIQPLCGVLT